MDDFKLVKSKSKKIRQSDKRENDDSPITLYNKVERCKQLLKDYDNDMYASKMIYKLKETIRTRLKWDTFSIISYGIGSFEDSIASRYQLALLLLIIDAFKQDGQLALEPAEAYDPQFSPLDVKVIEEHYHHLRLASSNERAMKEVVVERPPTLFYMPHCPKALYNNLVYANWSHDRLTRLVIVGNSFTAMTATDETSFSYLNDAVMLVDQVDLDAACEFTNAFVGLSLTVFRSDLPDETVKFRNRFNAVYDRTLLDTPIYDDSSEII